MARQPSKRLSLALSILAELPTTIRAHAADGGVVPVMVVDADERGISAHVPADAGQPGSELKVRVRDNDGCGHDITMGVRESFWAAEDVVEARLIVKGVRRFDGDRAAARTHLSDLALVHVEAGVATAAGLEFDARLVDIGSSGVSFVTTEHVREGDRVRVMATVDSRLVRLRARVLHVTAAHYGRNRIGCEVTELTTADRRLLDALTAAAPSRGSRSERFETRARLTL